MLAGAGKSAINLQGVLPFDGFDETLDSLYVRAVVFQNPDGTRACLVSVDATSMRDDSALREAAVSAVSCEPKQVWVTVTHTFSVPHVRTPEHLASDEERARNTLLAKRLAEAVRDACAQAVNDLVPVSLELAGGSCPINANRDVQTPDGWWLGINTNGFSDQTVRVLRIATAERPSHTVATLYTMDIQSSVVQGLRDEDGRHLASADLAGKSSQLLEERLGGVAVFLVGAAGDQTPCAKGKDALSPLGNALATAVIKATSDTKVLQANALILERTTIACPAQRRADFAKLAPTRHYQFVEEGTLETTLSVARLGELTIVGLEPEIDSALGARLRKAGKGTLEVLTMVNGAQKYLPSSQAYDRITYEAMNSGFARGADEMLARAILNLIN